MHKIKFERLNGSNPIIECQEPDSSCPYTRDCANHRTAGDFRTEGGWSPDLQYFFGDWLCSKKLISDDGEHIRFGFGAVLEDGTHVKIPGLED